MFLQNCISLPSSGGWPVVAAAEQEEPHTPHRWEYSWAPYFYILHRSPSVQRKRSSLSWNAKTEDISKS